MTPELIAQCTGATIDRARIYSIDLTKAMGEYGVTPGRQQAMFLAQIGHETEGMRWLKEIWGPTPAQVRYEGRLDLGNTHPGDGKLYLGRGMFQCTGKANYAAVRDRMRATFPSWGVPDFEEMPQLLEQATWASMSAGDYWSSHNLGPLADSGAIVLVTKRINGGTNGLADRTVRWENACRALGC